MSDVRFVVPRPDTLGPYVERLRLLEREILYPIADGADHFFIDHGPATTRSSPPWARRSSCWRSGATTCSVP